VEKAHGRVEDRRLWQVAVNPAEVGLAGAAQLVRIDRLVDEVRRGRVIKHTEETAYGVTTLWMGEADGERLLQVARDHWLIENGQHYRRDRTQDEDRCTVRETNSARVLSLFRSLAIYLYEAQRRRRGGKRSLPDYERHVHRHPRGLIRRFLDGSG
jgi:predicted transposase YbfD/YdcC